MKNSKKETLENVIECFENLNNTIGEITTEYHWREFCTLIEMLKLNFPEYNLKEFQQKLLNRNIKDINENINTIVSDNVDW